MPRIQLVAILSAVVLGAVAPAGAQAGFFGAETIDGPSADVARVGGVDVARDGTATVVYVKRVAGTDHVFAAQMANGLWQPPEQLDRSLPMPSSNPVVGVANRGAAIVAFINNGRLHTVVRRARDTAWPAPVALGGGSAATPSIDLSTNGVGYVVWTRGGDVLGALLGRADTAFAPLPAPLDIVPAAEAGTGTGRPRVATSADGTALAAWGESGHVYARRLLRNALSTLPQNLGVADLGGHRGGLADLPEVDIADDSSFAWVTFRQAFDDGATTRVLARRLVGSAFDPPADVGAGAFGGEAASAPAVDVAGSGDAIFANESTTSHTPFAALNYIDVLRAPFALSAGNTVPSEPAVAIGETSQAVAAWFDTDSGVPAINARSFKVGKPVDAETPLVDLTLGAVDAVGGLDAAADRYGDAVIAFTQGVGAGRRIMAATWDRPPVNLVQTTTYRWRDNRPIRWAPISEPWGDITWTVIVDGKSLGTTTANSYPIAGRVSDGVHKWTLVATDRRGQQRTAGPRSLRIDSSGPRLTVAIGGSRSAGASIRLISRARDRWSGVRRVRVDFGDGSPAAFGRDVRHRYAAGTHTIRVTATDKARNTTTVTRRLTIG
ncbi:MAG: PKD domain-containing protein [Solirubrobacteraceae bacterium]